MYLEYKEPIIANWANSSGEFSLLAPISRMTTFLPLILVGKGAINAALWTPSMVFKIKVDKDKLEILTTSNDGFEIAEKDLSLRGPGELVGVKQSGIPDFRYLNMIDDIKIFIVARDDARKIIAHKNDEEYRYLLAHCLKSIEYKPIIKV